MALSDDSSVGFPSTAPTLSERLLVFSGEMGLGKSLALERLLQKAIGTALEHSVSPVPIYLNAGRIERDVETSCLRESEDIGNPRILGAAVFIDHGDELGAGRVEQLLNEARTLVRAWPETTVVMANRPFPQIQTAPEAVAVRPLHEDESMVLVGRVAGRTISTGELHSWPEAVQHAVRRPLFAILMGGLLRTKTTASVRTPGQLIAHLVERGLGRATVEEAAGNETLRRIAIASTGAVRPVDVRDIGPSVQLLPLIQTGFLVEEAGRVAFALPILLIWFAAQAILTGDQPFDQICADARRLDRWKDALGVAVTLAGKMQADAVLTGLVEKDPAFAAALVRETVEYWGWEKSYPLDSAEECARQIRSCTVKWRDSFGDLTSLMRLFKSGDVPALGARTSGSRLTTAWYTKSDYGDAFEIPGDVKPFHDHTFDWISAKSGTAPDHPAWAWRWSLDAFTSGIKTVVDERALPLTQALAMEILWRAAVNIMHLPSSTESVGMGEFLRKLGANVTNTTYVTSVGRYKGEDLLATLEMLAKAGVTSICPPWPGRDGVPGRWIWDGYSQERLAERTQCVFLAAAEAVEYWYSTAFSSIASRLRKGVLFPARLIIHLEPQRGSSEMPSATRWWEPLPLEDKSAVVVTFSSVPPVGEDFDWTPLVECYRRLRPEAQEWLAPSISSGILDIFHSNSATELAYEWLAMDLQEASLMQGGFSRRL